MSHRETAQDATNPRPRDPGSDQSFSHLDLHAFQGKLQQAAERQQQLATFRRKLLVKREELRSSSKTLQAKRAEICDVEAAFMSLARQFHYQNQQPSETLVTAFEKMDEARNDLGVSQENHTDVERTLLGMEWAFMDQEEEFYQFELDDLLATNLLRYCPHPSEYVSPFPMTHPPPPPPHPPEFIQPFTPLSRDVSVREQSQSAPPIGSAAELFIHPSSLLLATQNCRSVTAELNAARKTFQTLRREQEEKQRLDLGDLMMDIEDEEVKQKPATEFEVKYFATLDSISTCAVNVQRLEQEVIQESLQALALQQRELVKHQFGGRNTFLLCPVGISSSENALPMLYSNLTVKQRVCQWLLIDLKESVIHRSLYLNILKQHGVEHMDDEELKDWAMQHWEIDNCGEEPRGGNEDELTGARDMTGLHSHNNASHERASGFRKFDAGVESDLQGSVGQPYPFAQEQDPIDVPKILSAPIVEKTQGSQGISAGSNSGPRGPQEQQELVCELGPGGKIDSASRKDDFLLAPTAGDMSRIDSCQNANDMGMKNTRPEVNQCVGLTNSNSDHDSHHESLETHGQPPKPDSTPPKIIYAEDQYLNSRSRPTRQFSTSSNKNQWDLFINLDKASRPRSEYRERDYMSRDHHVCSKRQHSRRISL